MRQIIDLKFALRAVATGMFAAGLLLLARPAYATPIPHQCWNRCTGSTTPNTGLCADALIEACLDQCCDEKWDVPYYFSCYDNECTPEP